MTKPDHTPLRVLVVGSAGSGKSTLVNALVGCNVLPNRLSTPPVPGLQVHIAHSQGVFAHLRFSQTQPTGRLPVSGEVLRHLQTRGPVPMQFPIQELSSILALPQSKGRVTWGQSPVEQVCLRLPEAPLRGLEFLDIQGFETGPLSPRVRQALAWADRVLFVTDVMHPLTPQEQNFLGQIPDGCARVSLVVNRMDILTPANQNECRGFVARMARELTLPAERFFLSAGAATRGDVDPDMRRLRAWLQEQAGNLTAPQQTPEKAPEPASQTLSQEPAPETKTEEAAPEAKAEEAVPEAACPPVSISQTRIPVLEMPQIDEEEPAEAPSQALSDAQYFSHENLDVLTGLSEHTRFAQELLDKYAWPEAVYQDMSQRLDAIQTRQKDRKLNVSVVGEFSAGKSTFVNALVRGDLLECGSVQGTTVASTIIEYGKSFVVATRHRDGSQSLVRLENFRQLRQCLNRLVSENNEAQDLSCVRVTLPSPTLRASNLRLIDTPGTDATTAWHEQSTELAISNFSDISILLVNGTRPLTDSFCRFVQENLSGVLDKCVFVVTKLDLVPPQERAKMLTYIRNKIVNTFELEKPLVLPYFSAEVMGTFSRNEFAQGDAQSLKISQKSEQYIRQHTARQRSLVLSGKLLELIDGMYEAVQRQADAISQDWEQELLMLQRSSQADLEGFVQEQKPQRLQRYWQRLEPVQRELSAALDARVIQAAQNIAGAIQAQPSHERLEAYLNQGLTADCVREAQALHGLVQARSVLAKNAMQAEIGVFQNAFSQLFESLNILNVDMSKVARPSTAPGEMKLGPLQDALKELTKQLSGGSRKLWGTAAGAAIGTAVVPVVGTVIGGAAGLLGGTLLKGDVSKGKKTALQRLQPVLDSYFRQVRADSQEEFSRYCAQVSVGLQGDLEQYVLTYRDQVASRIAQEESRKREIEEKLGRLRLDMDDIHNRKAMLDSIRETLAST